MRRALLLLLVALPASARTFTFPQILQLAQQSHAVPQSAVDAANALDRAPTRTLPVIRAETAITRGSTVDIFTSNLFRADAITTIVSADFPLLDGGARDAQVREARLDADGFRTRIRTANDALFRETVDAVAQLYAAQEKLKVLRAGLDRAVGLHDRAQQLVATHEISNTVAAQWEDESLSAQSQIVDLDLQRLDAETRVKQLIGDASQEAIEVELDLSSSGSSEFLGVPRGTEDPRIPRISEDLTVRRASVAVEEAEAATKPQLFASAFGGVARVDGPQYGVYGLRFSLTLPTFDNAAKRRVAEARLDAAEAAMDREAANERERREASSLTLSLRAAQKRIALLQHSVDIARQREESVTRLASAGVRSENAVAEAAFDRTRRESDLIAARVDVWKYSQLLEHRP